MKRFHPKSVGPALRMALFCGLLILGGPAADRGWAADAAEDPFGAAEEPAQDAAQESPPAPAAAAGQAAAEQPAVVVPDTPAVAAIRAADPSTPEALLRAINSLLVLDRPDLARTYLEKLQGMNLDVAAKSELQRQFGTAALLRLSRDKSLAPLGAEFAASVLEAARQQTTDPQQLAQSVSQLGAAARESRYQAATRLLRAGAYSVPPLVAAIAKGDSPGVQQESPTILAELGDAAVGPLSAYLASPDARLRATAVRMLGDTKSVRAMPYLVRPYFAPDADGLELQAATESWQQIAGRLPEQTAALQILVDEAERAYRGAVPVRPDLDNLVECWTWNQELQAAEPNQLLAGDAAAVLAARQYGELTRLQPEVAEYRQRHLIARLHVDQALGGLDLPLRRGEGSAYQLAMAAGPGPVQAALAQSLRDGYPAAAIGAAEVLADLGDGCVLVAAADKTAPLVQALTDPNRRVRFAAARAITVLAPKTPFAGSSRWADALGYLAGAQGRRQVLVAHPRRTVAQTLGGMLADAGFEPLSATTGAELIRRAVRAPDLELVVVSDRLNPESLWSWLEELRADPLTAELPVAIVASAETLDAARRVAEVQPRTVAMLQPTQSQDMLAELPAILALVGRDLVDRDQRLAQARVALDGLQQLASTPTTAALDLSRQQSFLIGALATPQHVAHAAPVLARIGTADAQLALLDYASQSELPLAARQAAAQAFAQSASSFGVLLTQQQVLQQYERYNHSRSLDAATQQLLSGLLDTIEAPAAAATAEAP